MMNETTIAEATGRSLDARRSGSLRSGADPGGRGAVEAWARAGARRLLRVAQLYLRDETAAEQVVRDVLLNALRANAEGDADAAGETRLREQTLALALRRLRDRPRRSEAGIEDLMPRFHADGTRVTPPAPCGPVGRTERGDRKAAEAMREHIDRLPELHRTVLLLTAVEALDPAAIADRVELGESRVRRLLHEARLALCTLLEPRVEDHLARAGGRRA